MDQDKLKQDVISAVLEHSALSMKKADAIANTVAAKTVTDETFTREELEQIYGQFKQLRNLTVVDGSPDVFSEIVDKTNRLLGRE